MSTVISLVTWKEAKGLHTECQVCGQALVKLEQPRGICRQCDELIHEKLDSFVLAELAEKEKTHRLQPMGPKENTPIQSIPQPGENETWIFSPCIDKKIDEAIPWVLGFAVLYLLAQIVRGLV